ncbi:MAG: GNAT family N-acetyltransferase [Pseudomonadota bacterium]
MTDVILRPARNADGEGIGALIAAVFADYPGCIYDRAAEFPELDAIADYFTARNGAMWVLERGGMIAGCLGVTVDQPGMGELHKVYLDRNLRGQGRAQQLLATAYEWLAHHHPACSDLMLWTDTRFAAGHRFYEKCGFVRSGQQRQLDDLSHSAEYHFTASLAALRPQD